jgi:hypothetical protein
MVIEQSGKHHKAPIAPSLSSPRYWANLNSGTALPISLDNPEDKREG